jgi:HlyD family secretion protein
VIAAAGILVVVALLALWLRPSPVAVEGARVRRGPLRVTIDEDGTTRVRDRYDVTTPISGRLTRITLEEGDSVRVGAVVASVDAALLDPRGRELAVAELRAAEDAESAAKSQVAQARTRAEQAARDLARIRELAPSGSVAASDVEASETSQRARAAELDAAVFRSQQLAHDVERARAALREPGASGARALRLRSPTNGRVLRVLERDERVVPAGTRLLQIGDPCDLEVIIDVLSTDAVRVKPGALVLLDAWGGDSVLTARVRRVEPSAFTETSALGIDEQRVNVIAELNDAPLALGDGYRVEAHIVVWEAPDVFVVPAGALFRVGSGWSVFVVERGRVSRRAVSIGHRNASDAEVLEGLASGDLVVLHPSDRVGEGTRVRVSESGSE